MTVIGRMIEERMAAPGRRMKASVFAEFSPPQGSIVFLGDSITEGGAWHEWFPDHPVLNRGISGDRTEGVLERLDTALAGPPSMLFLLIGTNDIGYGRRTDDIASAIARIISRIREISPDTRLIVQSVMPRTVKHRARLEALNARVKLIAEEAGAEFLDLWPALADSRGCLRDDFTADSLHLNGAGYRAWVALLSASIEGTVERG